MTINPIKLTNDTIDRNDIKTLIKWLSQDTTPQLTKGSETLKFESLFAKYLGTKYSLFCNSGSSAILLMLLALKAANRLKNNKCVVGGLSWVTDITSIIHANMEPILCDSNLNDLSVDLNYLEKLFEKEKPACFILVSVLGLIPDMDKIVALAKKYDVILLEDICESIGSEYQNKKLGTFGLMSCTSMYFSHLISTIEGGQVFTDDDELNQILISIRSHGWLRDNNTETKEKLYKEWDISEFEALYSFFYNGMNLRSTDLQAVIGISQLEKINQYVLSRNNNFLYYKSKIKNNLININQNEKDFVANLAYPIVSIKRDEIIKKLKENNVEVRPLIAGNMANKPFWRKQYLVPSLPTCEFIDKYGFYVPNNHQITKEQIDFICNIINEAN